MKQLTTTLARVGSLIFASQAVFGALVVDLNDQASIRKAAAQVAEDLYTFYPQKPGWFTGLLDLPPPDGQIHWWISGAFWGTILDYRHATGDKKYDVAIGEALLAQVGDDKDYLPRNWTSGIGNDDQAFWALSTMLAAETKFTDPAPSSPQWLSLAQAVFNEQSLPEKRAPPDSNCKSGVRWQRLPSSNGYIYINTVSNACYFNLGARLGRYTNNQTYASLAATTYDNIHRLGYIDTEWNVFDGAHMPACTNLNKQQFSYNAAMLMQGCAFMYNQTTGEEAQKWRTQIEGLVEGTVRHFFLDGIPVERSCEPQGSCNIDQRSFKGFLHRWMASTGQLAPFIQPRIQEVLKISTAAAVKQCVGGANGRLCGFNWADPAYDGRTGAVEQMNVLGALTALLTPISEGPVTNGTGGTSIGDPNAGSDANLIKVVIVTMGDRVGAGFLTVFIISAGLGVFVWMTLADPYRGIKV